MKQKKLIAVVSVALLLCAAVGGTLAWMTAKTAPVTNTFKPASVTTDIEESFDDGVKEDVAVKNTGDIPAYIRAEIIYNWADENGTIFGTPVESGDYILKSGSAKWKEIGKYYYYTEPVAANRSTEYLIKSITPMEGAAPAGYFLQVTILAEGIQAMPDDAIQEAWGVYPSNNWSTTAPIPPAEGEGGGTR